MMFQKVRLGCLVLMPVATACGEVQVLLDESFESGSPPQWTRVTGDAYSSYTVSKNNPSFVGSNFDGVTGDSFMLFGSGSNRGTIRLVLETVPGREYRLTYNCGGTDSWSVPQKSQSLTFYAVINAFHGMKTVVNHVGQLVEVEDLEQLASKTHTFTTPGSSNWTIPRWESAELTFRASSSVTRIQFNTPTTSAMASVGVLDSVLVSALPFVSLKGSSSGLVLEYSGMLETSSDLKNWAPVAPQPANVSLLGTVNGTKFFRVAK